MQNKKLRIDKKTIGWALVCTLAVVLTMLLGSCKVAEREKIRDLDALILSEEVVPAELAEIIEAKKAQPFRFTFSDQEHLYICIGYGKQETGGYSIALNELYLTDTDIVVSTTLLGPSPSEQAKKVAAYPYIVIQTELIEQPVIFR